MSLVKRGSRWWSYVTVDGIRHRRPTGTANRRQAETIDRQFHDELNEIRHRLPQLKPEMTLGELAALFIGSGMGRPHSLDRLKHLLPFFADFLLGDINQSATRKFRQERNREKMLKPATVNRDLSVLRRILNWGVEEGYLTANPLGRLHLEPERRTKRPVLSPREEQLLLAAAPEHLRRMILCALHTGLRKGEILSQQWNDIDFDNRILHVSRSKTPGGEAREIPLTNRLYELLLKSRRPHGPVFTYEGDPIKVVKTTWASSLRRSGIRHFRFHDLRHTANTRMMLAGVLQEVRREILGHSSQRSRDINDRYVQIELPEKREAMRKLELWLEAQALLLQKKEGENSLPPTPQAPTREEQTNDGNQTSAPAA